MTDEQSEHLKSLLWQLNLTNYRSKTQNDLMDDIESFLAGKPTSIESYGAEEWIGLAESYLNPTKGVTVKNPHPAVHTFSFLQNPPVGESDENPPGLLFGMPVAFVIDYRKNPPEKRTVELSVKEGQLLWWIMEEVQRRVENE